MLKSEVRSGEWLFKRPFRDWPVMNSASPEYTSALTVLTGVIIFVVGQTVLKFFIEPLQELRKTIGEIAFSLDFYANQMGESSPKGDEARAAYRQQACKLRGIVSQVHWLPVFAFFRLAPLRSKVEKASRCLIALSNHPPKLEDCRFEMPDNEIKRLLRIRSC
jgi:hypothetical protein